MNIVIINGSPRKSGSTATILHAMEQRLIEKENVDVEFVDISDLKMEPCRGCCSCYKTGHCYINDDAEKLSDRIEKAQGIIIGTPTYASNISGQLKQFIDRGHFVIEQLLHNKYAISVITGENYGSSDAGRILTKLLKYWYKFTQKNVTKENAVIKITEVCGFGTESIIAFGDDFADIGMLEFCGLGVAMGNAIDEVKNKADIVIGSNDEEGIAFFIEENLLIGGE